MKDKSNNRIIRTGLYGQIAFDILDSIFGQFSDGRWENSRGYDKYWQFAGARRRDDGEVVVSVSTDESTVYGHRWLENPYIAMSDAEVLAFLAKKIKAIAKECIKDNDEKIGWSRGNTAETCNYLDRKLPVTYADIYFLYEKILGRCNEDKYDAKTVDEVVGRKRTAAEAAAVKAVRARRDAANAKYSKTYTDLCAKRDAEIAEIQKKYRKLADEAGAELMAELKACDAA